MTAVISPVFERLFVASMLEDAAIKALGKWFLTYIHEIERQLDLPQDTLEPPRVITNRNTFDAEAGDPIPHVVVIAPGTRGEPVMTGNGAYRATWVLGVGVAMAAKDENTASLHAHAYGAIVRGIIGQMRVSKLGSTVGAVDVRWVGGERVVDLPIPDQVLLYKAVANEFEVDIENVLNKRRGPDQPDDQPYTYGQVQSVVIELRKEELDAA